MKLIDANVFIYANGVEHEYKSACVDLLELIALDRVNANVDIEIFQELLHYYHTGRNLELAVAVLRDIHTGFPDPLPVTSATMKRATSILVDYPLIQARDAVHAAVVMENGLEGILSADRGFDVIPGITRFDPKEF